MIILAEYKEISLYSKIKQREKTWTYAWIMHYFPKSTYMTIGQFNRTSLRNWIRFTWIHVHAGHSMRSVFMLTMHWKTLQCLILCKYNSQIMYHAAWDNAPRNTQCTLHSLLSLPTTFVSLPYNFFHDCFLSNQL